MSNGDKRSVSTDALETLGTAPLDEFQARDAIHLAVEPVIAGMKMFAGQDVGLVKTPGGLVAMIANKLAYEMDGVGVKPLGIVDPFLDEAVFPGNRFWLVVYPRQIKSLRHVWEHPDFAPSSDLVQAPAAPAYVAKRAKPATPPKAPEQKPLGPLKIEEAKRWMADWGTGYGFSYDEALEAGRAYLKYGHYQVDGGRFEGCSVPDLYWEHYTTITGEETSGMEGSFFSCSC